MPIKSPLPLLEHPPKQRNEIAPVDEKPIVLNDDNPELQRLFLAVLKGHGADYNLPLSKAPIDSKTAQVLATGISWNSGDEDEPLSEAGEDPNTTTGPGSAWDGSMLGSPMAAPGTSNNCTRGSLKRRREDDPDRGGPKRPRTGPNLPPTNHNIHPPFACPFYLHDPHTYPCQGFRRIVDVRQHIIRDGHAQVRHCPICGMTFESDDARSAHIRQRVCQPTLFYHPGATLDQCNRIRDAAQRGNITGGVEERWFIMWDILFPNARRPSSPYLHISNLELRAAYNIFDVFLHSGRGWSVVHQWLPRDASNGARMQAYNNVEYAIQSFLEFWRQQNEISNMRQTAADSAYSSQFSLPRTPSLQRNSGSRALHTNFSPTNIPPFSDHTLPNPFQAPGNVIPESPIPHQSVFEPTQEEDEDDGN